MRDRPEQHRSDDHRCFFVVGAPRSGTTMLSVILDRHSQVVMTPESHFFNVSLPKLAATRRTHACYVDALRSHARIRDLNLDREAFLRAFERRPCTPRDAFLAALSTYAVGSDATVVGEKTPQHWRSVSLILNWLPETRIIWLLRDGRDVVRSLHNVEWAHDNMDVHAVMWRKSAAAARLWQEREPSRVMVVRYEDIMTDPEAQLRSIMNFIELEYEPSQLEEHAEANSAVIPEWERAWKQTAAGGLDPSRIAAWTRETDDAFADRMAAIMGAELAAHGYPGPHRPRRRRWLYTFVGIKAAALEQIERWRVCAAHAVLRVKALFR